MGISLLAPLFLAGLAALAIPILVHLTNRDRKDVVRFPSLRFLTRLPYRQMRRQRIQHWFLFAVRALAIVLLVAAFSRPLIEGAIVGTDETPGREVVIALDRSYSMGYGDTWQRATEAVAAELAAQPLNSRFSLIAFDDHGQLAAGPTTDPGEITRALDTLRPGSAGTRMAAAIQTANQVLLEAPVEDREVVVVSDWQSRGWDRSSSIRLLPGTSLKPVDLSRPDSPNLVVSSVEVHRGEQDGRATVRLAARVVNRGTEPADNVAVDMVVDGQRVTGTSVTVPGSGSASATLGPVAHPPARSRVSVTIGDDQLAADNEFHLAMAGRPDLSVLVIEAAGASARSSLYLREALEVAEDPAMAVLRARSDRVRPSEVAAATVVILHDSPFPRGAAGQAIVDHVNAGGGLWIVLGSRSSLGSWPEEAQRILPGRWRGAVDRLATQGVGLASIDYDHPAFRLFRGPDDGNVASPRFYRYRPILPADSAVTLARYADGAVALTGVTAGGRVLLWGSPLDNQWSNLPVQPVFLPFVHQVVQYLSDIESEDGWHEAGQVLALADILEEMGLDPDTLEREMIIEGPSRERRQLAATDRDAFVTLSDAGYYSLYPLGREREAFPIAVNVDRTESDLTPMDIEAFTAASTAPDTSGVVTAGSGAGGLTPAERERRQGIWWFLIAGALALLVIESVWSNRPAQTQPAPVRRRDARPE